MTASKPFYIWEQHFASIADATPTGPGFSGPTHRTRAVAAAREAIDAVRAGRPIPRFHTMRTVVLPSVVACAIAADTADAPIRILDFGGGLGIGFLTLLESVPATRARVEYHIVDIKEVCEVGRALFRDEPRVTFHEELPPVSAGFTIVYSSSCIQYIEDWRAIVRRLAAYEPAHLLFSDVFAGKIPTFCAMQNYYDSTIPQWFMNIDEFLETTRGAGYRLGMQMLGAIKRLDREHGLDMDNYPSELRIPETLHLLFHPDR